jgi:hypothetical protein
LAKDVSDKWLVFISHSSIDTWLAERIEERIVACGATTFLDAKHIDIGDNFENVIRPALIRAKEVLFLLTPWALESEYVRLEMGAAWGRGKRLVFVLHGITAEEVQKSKMPVLVKASNLVRLNDIDKYFGQLSKRIATNSERGRRKNDD